MKEWRKLGNKALLSVLVRALKLRELTHAEINTSVT